MSSEHPTSESAAFGPPEQADSVPDRTTAAELTKLRHMVRGMRSRNQTVREFALAEARTLPLRRRKMLVKLTQRSFAEERRRKAFLRLASFYGSSTLSGFAIFLIRHLLPHPAFVQYIGSFWGWIALWYFTDRAVRQAFTPEWDARKVFLQEAEAQGIVTATDTEALQEQPQSEERQEPADAETGNYPSRSRFGAILDGLNAEDEAAHRQALDQTTFLTTEDLLALAEMQFRRCGQQIEREQSVRNKRYNVAYWATFVATLFHISTGFPIAFIAGVSAFYFRDRQVERALEGLVLLLRDVKELHPAPITLEMLTSEPDPTLLAMMKRRCPALETLIEDRLDEPEAEQAISEEELPALQAMSAETLATPYENVADTLAALKRLERIGDETVLPVVERLAAAPIRSVSVRMPIHSMADLRRDTKLIQEAAQSCLEAMHARLDLQKRMLLRASDTPATAAAETLLRPLDAAATEVRPDTLLRPHNPAQQIEQPVTAAFTPGVKAQEEGSEESTILRLT